MKRDVTSIKFYNIDTLRLAEARYTLLRISCRYEGKHSFLFR